MKKIPDWLVSDWMEQSPSEELASSIIHGIGVALSVAGLVLLVVFASLFGDVWRVVSFSIFGSTLIILYLSSTLFHGFRNPKVKELFRLIDLSSIYLLIAGTYTPLTLVSMRGPWGWTLFGLIWSLAIIGIIFKIVFRDRFEIVSFGFYIVMGWLVIIALKPMLSMVPHGMILWLFIGGISYMTGLIFYALKKLPYHHTIWHLFVLGGSASHFFGMLFHLTAK